MNDSDATTQSGTPPPDGGRRWRLSVRLRRWFFAGVLVTTPIGITIYLTWLVLAFVDARVTPLIPPDYNLNTYLPVGIPGLGLIVLLIVVTLIGAVATMLVGRTLVRWSEEIVGRLPVVRSIYSATKQIVETIVAQKSNAFREVVMFEYPRPGTWALGFVTGITEGEIQDLTEDEVVNVFLPTTPNPTSGYLLFVPRKQLVRLSMSVEEGIKMIISGGIVTPPDRRAPELRHIKRIPAAKATPVSDSATRG
ncbi:MAG: DUF502 domain-containing protein [Alphaproteobacteria bacterium]|nr:DUF502 domain-containing protein [Alphaproteobacteria bacterium]